MLYAVNPLTLMLHNAALSTRNVPFTTRKRYTPTKRVPSCATFLHTMTTLIQQRTSSDCTLACIAMAAGKAFDDLWTQDDLDTLLADKGCSDEEPYMLRAGFVEHVDYQRLYIHKCDQKELKVLLWRRRAMLSVYSLNIDGGSHHVYWDGRELFDPSTKKTYTYLSSLHITDVIIFSK